MTATVGSSAVRLIKVTDLRAQSRPPWNAELAEVRAQSFPHRFRIRVLDLDFVAADAADSEAIELEDEAVPATPVAVQHDVTQNDERTPLKDRPGPSRYFVRQVERRAAAAAQRQRVLGRNAALAFAATMGASDGRGRMVRGRVLEREDGRSAGDRSQPKPAAGTAKPPVRGVPVAVVRTADGCARTKRSKQPRIVPAR